MSHMAVNTYTSHPPLVLTYNSLLKGSWRTALKCNGCSSYILKCINLKISFMYVSFGKFEAKSIDNYSKTLLGFIF